jgi:hypothetical protein
LKKAFKIAFPWFGIILYLSDVGTDIVVGTDFIERCHYNYAVSVLTFFWLPGLLMGGIFSMGIIGKEILKEKYGYDIGGCGRVALFMLGTLLGPIIVIPGSLYCLVKAAINPSSDKDNTIAKL